MKLIILISFALLYLVSCSSSQKPKEKEKIVVDKKTIGLLPTESQPELKTMGEFVGIQPTGIAADSTGRVFVSFPRWRENIPFSVVEMRDGVANPYPDLGWNAWNGRPGKDKFTSVQSLLVNKGALYAVDPGSPEMSGVLGKSRLHKFDLQTNKHVKTWEIDREIAPLESYINDVRIDDTGEFAYLSDSKLGGIIVLNLNTGKAKRVLQMHPSTLSEDITLSINGTEFSKQVHADGLATNDKDGKLYYHALSGYHLYRVPFQNLNDSSAFEQTALIKKVEKLGVTPAPDGMAFDKKGNLYMGDLERNAISYRTPSGAVEILIQDERIVWPDSLVIDHTGKNLLFTDSRLDVAKIGERIDKIKFKVYQVKLP